MCEARSLRDHALLDQQTHDEDKETESWAAEKPA